MLPGFRPRSTIYETQGSLRRSLSGPLTSSLASALLPPAFRLCFCLGVL